MWLIAALLTMVAPPRNRVMSSSQAAHSAPCFPAKNTLKSSQCWMSATTVLESPCPCWWLTTMQRPTYLKAILSLCCLQDWDIPEVKELTLMWWILTNQEMDTYKLKWWIPTSSSGAFPYFCSKFHNMYAYVYYVITVWSVHLENFLDPLHYLNWSGFK